MSSAKRRRGCITVKNTRNEEQPIETSENSSVYFKCIEQLILANAALSFFSFLFFQDSVGIQATGSKNPFQISCRRVIVTERRWKRRWYLEVAATELPGGLKGNIFHQENDFFRTSAAIWQLSVELIPAVHLQTLQT